MMLLLEQLLNGLQYGAMLFILASGLTLIFGIMGVINLSHGSLYMIGAFVAAYTLNQTDSFLLAILAALMSAGVYGLIIERLVISKLYGRDHLYQVLATLGLIFFSNELVAIVFGRQPPMVETPAALAGFVQILPNLNYPIYRLLFIAVGILVALGLWFLINKTRIGMLVRAGADDREIVSALGVDIRKLYFLIFGFGAALCGLAGVMAAPLLAVEIGMGERILITTFVVIVIGGVGSIKGALVGALLVGMVDTLGRAFLPQIFDQFLSAEIAQPLAAGISSASIYLLMAIVLIVSPLGLFPVKK